MCQSHLFPQVLHIEKLLFICLYVQCSSTGLVFEMLCTFIYNCWMISWKHTVVKTKGRKYIHGDLGRMYSYLSERKRNKTECSQCPRQRLELSGEIPALSAGSFLFWGMKGYERTTLWRSNIEVYIYKERGSHEVQWLALMVAWFSISCHAWSNVRPSVLNPSSAKYTISFAAAWAEFARSNLTAACWVSCRACQHTKLFHTQHIASLAVQTMCNTMLHTNIHTYTHTSCLIFLRQPWTGIKIVTTGIQSKLW